MSILKFSVSILLALGCAAVSAQNYGITEVGYLDLNTMHSTQASDIWGYVDDNGNEYAIVGLNNGTSIVSVCDPANPVEVFFEPGTFSIWRDIKTWNNHAYITTEAQEGLLIIDLEGLSTGTDLTTTYYTPSGTFNGAKLQSHNIFIDENGFAYLFGSNIGNKGVKILDLNNDPKAPVEKGLIDDFRAHDGVVINDILYLANLQDGFFMYDVTDKDAPIMLGSTPTPNSVSHNVWFSDDQKYAYHTDEVAGAYIVEYNVEDPTDIKETDRIRTTTSNKVIPHNTHYINDLLVTSYYRDGVIIHDVSQKGNMVEVGRFDTSPTFSGDGFNGCWGVYPWLPSGVIIASDIENGLFILATDASIGLTQNTTANCNASNGVNENENLIFTPNPFSKEINFQGKFLGGMNVKLFNVLGEIVVNTTLESNTLELSHLLNGPYFVVVSDEEKVLFKQKLIKE